MTAFPLRTEADGLGVTRRSTVCQKPDFALLAAALPATESITTRFVPR